MKLIELVLWLILIPFMVWAGHNSIEYGPVNVSICLIFAMFMGYLVGRFAEYVREL